MSWFLLDPPKRSLVFSFLFQDPPIMISCGRLKSVNGALIKTSILFSSLAALAPYTETLSFLLSDVC